MTPDKVASFLKRAQNASEALFTFGERPEVDERIALKLKSLGYKDFILYVADMNKLAISHGLLPHTNAGVLSKSELKILKPLNASMGLMLEQAVELPCHDESPGKKPEERIRTIKDAGKLQIPFTTGLLIGIGETHYDRLYSLEVIADIHDAYGHIQEVIVQNFSPKKGTPMENTPPPSLEEMIETVKAAREILPKDVVVQIPANLVDILPLLDAGARDIGGISSVTPDYINPEAPWPSLKKIESSLKGKYVLRERLPVHPKYVRLGCYGQEVAKLVEKMSDEEGYRCL
jgi:FO synthase subunit 1